MHGEVLLGTLVDTFLPELQERAENPTRPCSAAGKGPCTEQDRVCVCVCLCFCAVSSETRNRKEEPCQDDLSCDRRSPCITHPEGCAPRSRRTSHSPDNENNEVRLSKETAFALPTNLSPREGRRIIRKVTLSSQSQGQI